MDAGRAGNMQLIITHQEQANAKQKTKSHLYNECLYECSHRHSNEQIQRILLISYTGH